MALGVVCLLDSHDFLQKPRYSRSVLVPAWSEHTPGSAGTIPKCAKSSYIGHMYCTKDIGPFFYYTYYKIYKYKYIYIIYICVSRGMSLNF